MSQDFFYSDFAKSSKFKWDFINKVRDIEEWHFLSNNFHRNFQNLQNKSSLQKTIPKKIHQIWIGSKAIPKKYLKWSETWMRNNPGWEYKLWTDKEINLLSMKNRHLYESINNIGFRSDIARYEILYNYGGLYIDTDFECINKIPDNLRYFDFVSCIGFNYNPEILNGFLMSSRKSKIINAIINDLKEPKDNQDPMKIINSSGPIKLTKIYFLHKFSNSMILPSNYCYPYPSFLINSSLSTESQIESESFAVHHWEMSWMKVNFIKRLINKINLFNKFKIKN